MAAGDRGDGQLHLTSNPIDWYVARTAGVLAYCLLTLDVALGLGLSGRMMMRRWPRFALQDVHRFTGILTGVFLGVHIGAVAIDSFKPFSLTQLAVPFAASYRPLWTALGIVAAELLAAIAIANWLRRRIPFRVWRTIHYLTLAVWVGATLHGVGAGTDRGATWLHLLYAASTALVAVLFLRRIGRTRYAAAGVLAGAVPLMLLVGPLAPAPRANERSSLREQVNGRILQQTSGPGQIVSMTGTARRPFVLLVRADLLILPGVHRSNFQLEYVPGGRICRGSVGQVRPFGFSGTCTMAGGESRQVAVDWKLLSGDRLRGTVAVQPA